MVGGNFCNKPQKLNLSNTLHVYGPKTVAQLDIHENFSTGANNAQSFGYCRPLYVELNYVATSLSGIYYSSIIILVYNLRLISYMPDKLVAILFYWSLNAKSLQVLVVSSVCNFHLKRFCCCSLVKLG